MAAASRCVGAFAGSRASGYASAAPTTVVCRRAGFSKGHKANKAATKRAARKGVALKVNTSMDEADVHIERMSWEEAKEVARPSQVALGWDWTFYKMKHFSSFEEAQDYMNRKPVPYIAYDGKMYVIDHHHTLAALELSGWNVEVTMEEIRHFDAEDVNTDSFWGIMEGRGWSFIWDADYERQSPSELPKTFELTAFRNDVFRSLGGFARLNGLLKRGKTLEDRLFFEFQWGYLYWLHRSDDAMWPNQLVQRGFDRTLRMVEETDEAEYVGDEDRAHNVHDMIFLSREVLQPIYQVLIQYLAHLTLEYDALPDEEKTVPGLRKIFGRDTLPGFVLKEAYCTLDLGKQSKKEKESKKEKFLEKNGKKNDKKKVEA